MGDLLLLAITCVCRLHWSARRGSWSRVIRWGVVTHKNPKTNVQPKAVLKFDSLQFTQPWACPTPSRQSPLRSEPTLASSLAGSGCSAAHTSSPAMATSCQPPETCGPSTKPMRKPQLYKSCRQPPACAEAASGLVLPSRPPLPTPPPPPAPPPSAAARASAQYASTAMAESARPKRVAAAIGRSRAAGRSRPMAAAPPAARSSSGAAASSDAAVSATVRRR
eukprot:scaffold8461_cov68-Phaeocystis_antarctica.AAC.4